MSNPNKARGTSWESEVTQYQRDVGLPANRTGSAEAGMGDIHAGQWTFECKAEKTIDLPGYLRQLAAAVERRRGLPYKAAAWVKNRRHGIKDAYVVMSGENFRSLMVYVESMESMLAEFTAAVFEYEQAGQHD